MFLRLNASDAAVNTAISLGAARARVAKPCAFGTSTG